VARGSESRQRCAAEAVTRRTRAAASVAEAEIQKDPRRHRFRSPTNRNRKRSPRSPPERVRPSVLRERGNIRRRSGLDSWSTWRRRRHRRLSRPHQRARPFIITIVPSQTLATEEARGVDIIACRAGPMRNGSDSVSTVDAALLFSCTMAYDAQAAGWLLTYEKLYSPNVVNSNNSNDLCWQNSI